MRRMFGGQNLLAFDFFMVDCKTEKPGTISVWLEPIP